MDQGIPAYHWSADVWPQDAFQPNYRTWKQQRPPHKRPLNAPAALAAVPSGVIAGARAHVRAVLCCQLKQAPCCLKASFTGFAHPVHAAQRLRTAYGAGLPWLELLLCHQRGGQVC